MCLTCTSVECILDFAFIQTSLLSASGNGADFLQLKTEIEAMVLTHFTLVYFRLSPHTCSWAQQEEGPQSWSQEAGRGEKLADS